MCNTYDVARQLRTLRWMCERFEGEDDLFKNTVYVHTVNILQGIMDEQELFVDNLTFDKMLEVKELLASRCDHALHVTDKFENDAVDSYLVMFEILDKLSLPDVIRVLFHEIYCKLFDVMCDKRVRAVDNRLYLGNMFAIKCDVSSFATLPDKYKKVLRTISGWDNVVGVIDASTCSSIDGLKGRICLQVEDIESFYVGNLARLAERLYEVLEDEGFVPGESVKLDYNVVGEDCGRIIREPFSNEGHYRILSKQQFDAEVR